MHFWSLMIDAHLPSCRNIRVFLVVPEVEHGVLVSRTPAVMRDLCLKPSCTFVLTRLASKEGGVTTPTCAADCNFAPTLRSEAFSMFAFELARRADLQRADPARRAWVPRGEEVAAAEAPTKAAGAVAKATAGAATGAAANFKGLQQPQEQSLAHGQHWVADSSRAELNGRGDKYLRRHRWRGVNDNTRAALASGGGRALGRTPG